MDHANIAMRAMPWYQEQMRQWGQDPGHPQLAKSQRAQILKLAQANGFVVDQGHMEIDAGGNFDTKGHALRNTLIVAGLAAATIATMGAAGAFSGAAAAGMAGGASGAGAAGLGGAGAAGLGAGTLFAGGTATGLAGAGVGAGTAAAIGGGAAAAGLGAAALPGAGTALGVAGGVGASGAAAGGAGVLGSSMTVPAATGTIGGGTSLTGLSAAARNGFSASGGGSSLMGLSQSELSRYGLSTAGNLVNGYLQNRAASQAEDKQQKYLDEALAYAKEQDAYSRKYKEGRDAVEASRYGDYSGRIAPYLATGASANDRMASLLGLPSGGSGLNRGAPSAASPVVANPAPIAAQPMAQSAAPATITVQAPDGSTQQRPATEADHWTQRGARILQGAA